MAEFFRIYKGENVVDEGESPLSISNLEPNTDVEKGEFQAVRVKTEGEGEDREENESDRVDIPSFKTLPIEVTGVSLDNTELELEKGGTSTLKATVEPSNATEKGVNWKSDNTDVAKVSGGKVTAVAEGKANITVTTKDGGKTATCAVTVKPETVKVTGVSLDKETLSVEEGASATLKATVEPSNATNKKVSWKSDDEETATVDSDGKVTGVASGNATITVTTEDGGKTATCAVTVTEPEEPDPEDPPEDGDEGSDGGN